VAPGGQGRTRLYTRTGDAGQTGLVGGHRVSKTSPRIRAFGALDELGAHLGWAESALPASDEATRRILLRLGHETFVAMSELATPPSAPAPEHRLTEAHVRRLESDIDRLSAAAEPLRSFVLPRGTPAGAALHVARTVARRAERDLWALHAEDPVRPDLLRWANRVSDLLFAMALAVNRAAGFVETPPDYTV
jgi:cob(I)alamin adenosyltransferase